MGYNGRKIRESYEMETTSNGLGGSLAVDDSPLAVSMMSNVSGSNHNHSSSNNQIPLLQTSQSNLSRSPSLPLGRATNLNPNAAEFVPNAFKSPATRTTTTTSLTEQQAWDQPKETVGSRLDRTNSSNSNTSDDDYRRFCRAQLPDDLMPDFDFGDFVESPTTTTTMTTTTTTTTTTTDYEPGWSPTPSNWAGASVGTSSIARPPYMPELRGSSVTQQQWTTDGNETGAASFTEWGTFPEDLTEVVDPVAVLVTEFPGFASESLADIYYANGGDLALTMDMLTELELQNEGAAGRQFQQQPPTPPAPPSSRDFPALAGLTDGLQQLSGRAARLVPDFAAAVRKQAAQQQQQQQQQQEEEAAQLQFKRNSGGVGGGYQTREARDRLEPFHGLHGGHEVVQAPATWLETGDSVANMYADMREEAQDHARVRNAYFDQARQAYLTGNKALAKELSAKGQWHNEQMKAAHSKAGEAIFWQRNSNAFVNNNNNNSNNNNLSSASPAGQPHLIDLHGLHVGEAISLLKREIAQLRYTVQNTRQRANVFICVGTGHHTKGLRTPSRLPAAVQRYLLEEEHFQFTEPQAGMLRIIIR